MSVETIAVIISIVTMLLAFFGVVGWLAARIYAGDQKLSARIDTMDDMLTKRIDSLGKKLSGRIDGVERELIEVKIGLARLERPPRRLLPVR
ncbi:MAG TPA: hypothetical protein VFN24_03360 [Microbacterium sp.]|nr:hypothetical protein [Microbacterium sp.]